MPEAQVVVVMGVRDAARKSYQDFLTLWKDADPDIPIYRQAKAEYARVAIAGILLFTSPKATQVALQASTLLTGR